MHVWMNDHMQEQDISQGKDIVSKNGRQDYNVETKIKNCQLSLLKY